LTGSVDHLQMSPPIVFFCPGPQKSTSWRGRGGVLYCAYDILYVTFNIAEVHAALGGETIFSGHTALPWFIFTLNDRLFSLPLGSTFIPSEPFIHQPRNEERRAERKRLKIKNNKDKHNCLPKMDDKESDLSISVVPQKA
jgi:hypothetical protein